MKVLVTGGAGFIGSHLCEALIEQGHGVVAIDNLLLGRREHLAHLLPHPDFAFDRQDLLDVDALRQMFQREAFEAVFHLAANSDIQTSGEDPSRDLQLTFMTTYHVLLCMREYGVKPLVFSSSSAIYGELPTPLREDTGPLFPISHYGAAKLASEAFIASWCAQYGFQAWIFRFPNVVGERATHGVLVDLLDKLARNPHELEVLGDGTQQKPYLYVTDVVQAMLFTWQRAREPLNCFNIGVEGGTKVSTIVEMILRELRVQPKIVYTGGRGGWPGDVPIVHYDTTKLRKLGWMAHYTSDEAVELAVKKLPTGRR